MTLRIEEVWRPVPGYEGLYEVSDQGRVRSLPRERTAGRILKPNRSNTGYLTVNLYKGGDHTVTVHSLVAAAFIGTRPAGMQVRHLNGDRLDPRRVNLAYGTATQNTIDSVVHGTHFEARRTACPKGHLYTEANIRRTPSRPNARYCRECERLRGKGPGALA